MFQISLTNILVTYLVITLVVLFGVWLAKDWTRKRREKKDRKYRLVIFVESSMRIDLGMIFLPVQVVGR